VFFQQVWCVDNRIAISYFRVTFKIIKCDEIQLEKLKLKYKFKN